jgi:hypothetical protein
MRRLAVSLAFAIGVLAVVVLVAGCLGNEPSAAPGPAYTIGVSNGTTLTVTLVVNGRLIESFPPDSGTTDPILASRLGPLPWAVEARSASGRVLTSMTVHEGDLYVTVDPNGGGSANGIGGRVDLSCGRLDIWSGAPMIGPAPGSGSPGDCAP